MELIKATQEIPDHLNEKLLHYFSQGRVPGPVQTRQRRMFHFFNQYRIQSNDHTTYLLLNKNKQIEAMASLIFRQGYIDGQKQTIGYATDLRVSPTRHAILNWSQHFMPVLEEEKQKRECRYMFSVVAHSQRQAYNAFIRPRSLRRNMPRYHLFRRFQLVSLHGLWPFHPKPIPGIKIRTARESDFAALSHYVVQKHLERPLHYYSSATDFKAGLERWRDLYIENFILALDRYENIIGCVAPWSPERVQRIYPSNYSAKAQNLKDLLKLFSWIGIAKPLANINQEMELRLLTHLFADNPDILYSLLFHAYQMSGKNEFLLYSHFEGDILTTPPSPFIAAEVPYGYYCILSPNEPTPDFLKPRLMQPAPIFEPAFI